MSTPSHRPAGRRAAAARPETCPACGELNPPGATACAACTFDIELGDWSARVAVDPDWHAHRQGADPLPQAREEQVVRLEGDSLLLGRPSQSRSVEPDLDLGGDPGVSRRHARLTRHEGRWLCEDLGSSNGTFVGAADGPLPTIALTPGLPAEIEDGAHVYLGAWTRLTLTRRPGANRTE